MSRSAKERLAALPSHIREEWLAQQPPDILADIQAEAWWWVRRPEQVAPPGDWFLWLILSGRGWGKTRCGAEWIIDQALRHPTDRHGNPTDWLVIGETLADTRTFCIDGPSGMRNVLRRRGYEETLRPPVRGSATYQYIKAPKPILMLPDGQRIYCEGCDDEDTGRGYTAAGAWLDEVAKWRYFSDAWREGVMPSIRADLDGDIPRVVVTTTPKPIVQLRDWVQRSRDGDPAYRVTVGATFDNAGNLSPHTLAELRRQYVGTTLGRQELYGELLDEAEGALWRYSVIDDHRVRQAPALRMTVVGMDPPGTGTGDEMGLVAVGRGVDDEHYVLADWSGRMVGHAAARRAWLLFREVNADMLIFEDNFGKKWLEQVMKDVYNELRTELGFPAGGSPPMRGVTALQGKRLRAEPYAMRYEQGHVHHVGGFADLETQMVSWVPDEDLESPDRVDALVHAGMWLRGRERQKAGLALPPTGLPRPGLPAPAAAALSTDPYSMD